MTMGPDEIPVVGAVFEFGAEDRVLDTILLLGPLVVLAFVVLGRTPLAEGVVTLYLVSFVGYVLYSGLRR